MCGRKLLGCKGEKVATLGAGLEKFLEVPKNN